jgi:hypothetical protein
MLNNIVLLVLLSNTGAILTGMKLPYFMDGVGTLYSKHTGSR